MSGFSVSTVSKALNDKQDISKETRQAIKNIAKKLNYIPNNFAVALRGKRSKTIAVLLPSVTDSNYNQALFYLQKSAESSNYRVMLFQTFNSEERETKYINRLNDGSIDGVIVVSSDQNHKLPESDNSFPIVALNVDDSKSIEDIKQSSYSSVLNVLNA
jgi:LacI family transcriptional regulator